MSLFNFKSKDELVFVSNGYLMPIDKVNDETFSNKLLGNGYAISPVNNIVCAPCDGEIIMIAETKHAFGIKRKDGSEILVHVGLDTCKLNGEGLESLVSINSVVKKGDYIIRFDKKLIEDGNLDMTIIVVFIGNDNIDIDESKYGCLVEKGEVVK